MNTVTTSTVLFMIFKNKEELLAVLFPNKIMQ